MRIRFLQSVRTIEYAYEVFSAKAVIYSVIMSSILSGDSMSYPLLSNLR